MAKPTEYSRWATSGSIVDPPSGTKDAGWVDGDPAAAEYANWLANNAYQWQRWFDAGDTDAGRRLVELAQELLDFAPSGMVSSDISTSKYVFAHTARSGYLSQGVGNNQIFINRGTLYQAVSASSMLGYALDGTDTVTIANNASANPRVDLIQIKIEPDDTVDGKRTKKTISVKQGANGASTTTCTIPTLDAGFVALGSVYVGGNYAAAATFKINDSITATTDAVIHDQRLPLGLHTYNVQPRNMRYDDTGSANAWTPNNLQDLLLGTGTTPGNVIAICPSDQAGRLIGASLVITPTVVSPLPNFYIMRLGSSNTSQTMNTHGGLVAGANAVVEVVDRFGAWDLAHLPPPSSSPVITASSQGIGVPTWTNGCRCWTPNAATPVGTFTTRYNAIGMWMDNAAHNSTVWRGMFRVAGNA